MLHFQVDPLSSLMGGGGGPPGGPGGGPPPSIQVPGQAPPPGAEPEGAAEEDQPLEAVVQEALRKINKALARPDVDPEDASFAEQATSALTKILANDQKNQDAAMGIGPPHKAVRKATRRAGGEAGGSY